MALKIEIANKFAYCYFARTELMLLLMPEYEPVYAFPLLIAESYNYEKKTNYLSLKETQKKKHYNHKSFLRLFQEDNLFYY